MTLIHLNKNQDTSHALNIVETAPRVPRWATIIGQNGTWSGYVFESCFRGEVIIFGALFGECFGEQERVVIVSGT